MIPREPSSTAESVTSGHSPAVWVAGCAAAVFLAVLAPFLLVDWQNNVATPFNILLALTIVAFSAWRLTVSIVTGRADLPRSFFYVFIFIFLGVSALAQTVSGVFPLDARTYASQTITVAFLNIIVGIVAYEIGWHLYKRRNRKMPVMRTHRPEWAFSPIRTALVGAFGLLATGYQVQQFGLGTFFTSRQETTNVLAGQGLGSLSQLYMVQDKTLGLLTIFLTQYPIFIALFVILYSRRHHLWPRSSLAAAALWRSLILLLVVANIVINNPIGNGRYWFLLLLATFVSIYVPYQRRVASRTFVAGALFVFMFAFVALDAFRNTDVVDFDRSGPQEALSQDATYSMFQMDLNANLYVNQYGHSMGRQALGNVFSFIPRGVWDDKPIATGQLVDSRYLRSTTAWAEMQVDFGTLGIAGFFLLYGVGSAALTNRSKLARPGFMHAILILAATFQFLLLRGSLQPALGVMYQLILILALVVAKHPMRSLQFKGGTSGEGGQAGRSAEPPPRKP